MPSYNLATGDIVESRWNATLAGQSVMFVLHHQIGAGTSTGSDLLDFQVALDAAVWEDKLSAGLSPDVTGCYWQSQTIAPTRKITNEILCTPGAGTLTGAACPPTTAIVIRKRTINAGRTGRGRIFIPGVPFSATLNGRLVDAQFEDWDSYADNFQFPITFNGRTATPIVYSTKSAVNRGVILDCNFDPILRVQRRREVGRGI